MGQSILCAFFETHIQNPRNPLQINRKESGFLNLIRGVRADLSRISKVFCGRMSTPTKPSERFNYY